MSRQYKNFVKGISIVPKSQSSQNVNVGDIEVLFGEGKARFFTGSINDPIVMEATLATLTNKSINSNTNFLSNIKNSDLNGSAGITNANLALMSANTVKANITGSPSTPTDIPFVSTNTPSSGVLRDSSGNTAVNNLTANKVIGSTIEAAAVIELDQTVDTTTIGDNLNLPLPATSSLIFGLTSPPSGLIGIKNIVAGAVGQLLLIKNNSGASITFYNNTSGTGAKIITGTQNNLIVTDQSTIMLEYNSYNSAWNVIGGSGSTTSSGNMNKDVFSGNASQTVFTLNADPTTQNNTFVFISGVYQQKSTYTISSTTLTFSSAPPTGTNNIEVLYPITYVIGTPSDNTVSTVKIQDGAVTNNKLTVMPALTIKGNNTGSNATPIDLTVTQINALLSFSLNPTGTVLEFAGATAPTGYLMADGSAISRTTYATLFSVIGTIFGNGDGSTTFNIPNRQGIFARGAGSQTISSKTFTATLGIVAKDTTAKNGLSASSTDSGHSHQEQAALSVTGGGSDSYVPRSFPGTTTALVPLINTTTVSASANITTNLSGDAETAPAYIVMNYIIKT